MSNVALYIVAVLIWGSTWFAITFQLGHVPPEVSIAYRFALASLLLLSYGAIRKFRLRFSIEAHAWMALQGMLFFSFTYVCAYLAAGYISSGLVAVAFSFVVFLNMFGMRVFFKTPLRFLNLLGATFGMIGVALIFAPAIGPMSSQRNPILGLVFAFAGTSFASLGNMVTLRNYSKGIPVVPLNAFAMLYGALFVAAYALLIGKSFLFEWNRNYILSLLYLSVIGSVFAFSAYVTLIGRIGADRAGYVAVAVPVVALTVSTLFEGLHWQPVMYIGLICCLVGNVLVLRSGRAA